MSYGEFATILSVVVAVMYATLLGIAVRRAKFRDRRAMVRQESVAIHARSIEGPIFTVLFFVALFTLAAATVIGSPDYVKVAGYAVASIRGALFFLGLWALGWYWRQRATWV